MELIKVSQNAEGQSVVSARELHAFLEVLTRFDKWIIRMFEYGFKENQDYAEVTVKNDHNLKGGKSTLIDYALTLNCAKEISMVQRTEKGKQARQYFLECEKQLKAIQQNLVTQSEFLAFKKLVKLNFSSTEKYVLDMEDRLEILEANRTHDTQRITEIELVVAELMRVFGIGADCFVYVFYNPQNNFYKLGRSKHIGNRKEDFQTVQKELVLQIAIPTRTKAEAVKLENTLKIKFMDENKYGEWYAFDDAALDYLRGLQQLHQDFLASESN